MRKKKNFPLLNTLIFLKTITSHLSQEVTFNPYSLDHRFRHLMRKERRQTYGRAYNGADWKEMQPSFQSTLAPNETLLLHAFVKWDAA